MRPSRSAREDNDLNIVPMMNLFVVLVPMLLLSAVFVQVAAIDLATAGDAAPAGNDAGPPTVTITSAELRVQANPGAKPSARIDRSSETALADLELALGGLSEASGGPEIIIASSSTVRYQGLIDVIDRAAAAGYSSYSLAAYEEASHAP